MNHHIKDNSIDIALAWCLAWGDNKTLPNSQEILQEIRQAFVEGKEVSAEVRAIVEQVKQLSKLPFPKTVDQLKQFTQDYPLLWNSSIGLVYGGATKIKQYVFEESKLPDIRGASALLDRINLIDIPAFFQWETDEGKKLKDYCFSLRQKLTDDYPQFKLEQLWPALIPELIIYSTGGNILAFCPSAFVDDLANLIEIQYTKETLTANSCAVGAKFKPLEVRFGLLAEAIDQTFWLQQYLKHQDNPIIKANFNQEQTEPEEAFKNRQINQANLKAEEAFKTRQINQANLEPEEAFKTRKSFNELVTKLTILLNQRRSGNKTENRSSRCYPAMFETHPYLKRDENESRLAIFRAESDPNDPAKGLPGDPWLSDSLARKRITGQQAKRYKESQDWYYEDYTKKIGSTWEPGNVIDSWVYKFEKPDNQYLVNYYQGLKPTNIEYIEQARSVREIGNASYLQGFVAYIYADGNNVGGYIQNIKTPEEYKKFSRELFDATEKSVYKALATHLKPHQYKPDAESSRKNKDKFVWIHPFEIVTIGGDDVLLIVPADKALAIAKTIGEEFERLLLDSNYQDYKVKHSRCFYHRYKPQSASLSESKLSMSIGVLITEQKTPIYYAQKLVEQLLKSAKKKAKSLKKSGYYGGTIDFLTMKSVTMLSSSIEDFREQGLKKERLKFYAAPYTLHEIGGLIKTIEALQKAKFPRSQLYQIRSLLEQGRHTAILNYLYYRCRLKEGQQEVREDFEKAWCNAKTNDGNIAPWMYDLENKEYETIWRDLVDLYPFFKTSEDDSKTEPQETPSVQR